MPGTCIYYLLDPRTSEVRYVGYTKTPASRFKMHLADRRRSHKCRWIASLLRLQIKPVFSTQCILQTEAEAQRVEIALIALLRSRGARLTNATAGGDGGDTYSLSLNKETRREKHRKAAIGNSYSKGKKRSEDQKATYRASWTPERRVEHSEHRKIVMLGNKNRNGPRGPMSADQRKKLSDAWTLEKRAAMAAKRIGNTHGKGYQITAEQNDRKIEGLRKAPARNTTGIKGVYPTKKGYFTAHLTVRGKRIYLGHFSSLEEATKARHQAEQFHYKEEEVQS